MSLNEVMNNPFKNFNNKVERLNDILNRDALICCTFKRENIVDRIRSEEKEPSISEKITEATNERAKELCSTE